MLRFCKILTIFIISAALIFVAPILASSNNVDIDKALAEARKTQVQIQVLIPFREGCDADRFGSGTVIAKLSKKDEISNRVVNKIVYFIHTNPHVVFTIEKLLVDYKEAGIRIYILGKNNEKRKAEIVAWNWRIASLLLRTEILESDLDKFNFKAVKIANTLPISLTEERFSEKLLAETVYPFGYPYMEPNDSEGKVTEYRINEKFKDINYSYMIVKTMHIAAKGLVGSGQSGGGVFVINRKTGEPEWAGTVFYGGGQLMWAVPVDVTVERFLKEIPQLKDLIDFPNFQLDSEIGWSKTIMHSKAKK